MRLLILIVIFYLNLICTLCNKVITTLESKWAQTHFIHEISEYLYQESPQFYWNFIEKAKNNYNEMSITWEDDILIHTFKELLANEIVNQQNIIKFILSLKLYSPKLEMFRQIYLQYKNNLKCNNFILYDNQNFCEMPEIPILKLSEQIIYHSVDHRYPAPYQNYSLPTYILYSDFLSPHFLRNHKVLKDLAIKGLIDYYYRPILNRDTNVPLNFNFLSGFGVELAIKNTEYRAKDDSGFKNVTNLHSSDFTSQPHIDRAYQYIHNDIIKGINVTLLKNLFPNHVERLDEVESQLTEETFEMKTLKGWELQDLSFQTSQIMNQATTFEDKVKVMREISQNLPSVAPDMVGVKVDLDLRKEIIKNQYTYENYNLAKGESAFYLNRMLVDMDPFNVYQLYYTMMKELKPMAILHYYGFKGEEMQDMLATKVELKEGDVALDFSNTKAIMYVNDLEKDKRYQRWTNTISVFEQTFWFGMVTEIRRNLFNLIILINPIAIALGEDPEGLRLLTQAKEMYLSDQPYHIGIVPIYETDSSRNVKVEETDTHDINASPWLLYEPQTIHFHAILNYIFTTATSDSKIDALNYILQVNQLLNQTELDETEPDNSRLIKVSCNILNEKSGMNEDACVKLGKTEKYLQNIDLGREFYENSGLDMIPQVLFNGIPMSKQQLDSTLFDKEVTNMMTKAYYHYYESYFNKLITDRTDIIAYLNKRSNVLPRINKNILSTNAEYIDFRIPNNENLVMTEDNSPVLAYLPHVITPKLSYLIKKTDSPIKPITLWLVIDLDVENGRKLMAQALKFIRSSLHVRLAIIHNPPAELKNINADEPRFPNLKSFLLSWGIKILSQSVIDAQTDLNVKKLMFNKLLKLNFNTLAPENGVESSNSTSQFNELVEKIIPDVDLVQTSSWKEILEMLTQQISVSNTDIPLFKNKVNDYVNQIISSTYKDYDQPSEPDNQSIFRLHGLFCRHSTFLPPKESAIVANGRIIRISGANAKFTASDFSLLEKFLYNAVSKNVVKKLEEDESSYLSDILDSNDNKANDLIMKLSSVLLQNNNEARRIPFKVRHDSAKSCITNSDNTKSDRPRFDILAIVDPLSRPAQMLSQVLLTLNEVFDVDIKLCYNCKAKLSDMPIKNYFRYVLYPSPLFIKSMTTADSPESVTTAKPAAIFEGLPKNPLLTLIMHTPPSWMIQSIKTAYDLDNINMDEVPTNVYATYQLEYILLEGHCFDKASDKPPRGLEFTMGPISNPLKSDTIVMANLGYFQLKGHPGAFILKLRAGKSEDIYRIVGHKNTDSPVDTSDQELIVVLDSFSGKTIHVKVAKKSDKMNEELLEESPEDSAKLNNDTANKVSKDTDAANLDEDEEDGNITTSTTNNYLKTSLHTKKDVINIFSVASGHLYERFLKIMMLSVLKHTKSPVKFWFLKNYLSPSFKEFIPHMAKAYNFSYEFVQYKWPQWLNQQTEKQRIIWGYKILFLDVLFPLDVDKIIYVDADQIVRTDLKELVDFDLGGAPYGYTPFCDSRKEMEGFRFWKSGYWSSHLAHRKYHISALYVVDLKKFRQIAAGDRLRGQYQGLSQDPNSLSNLDQDLPNNMIHQVAIKSLPQDWLWCETWCDDSSKARAKTIDLCNNPMTKEPKLHSAVRIIPEWTSYDNEIKNFTDNLLNKLPQSSQQSHDTLLSNTTTTMEPVDVGVKHSKSSSKINDDNHVHNEL